MYSVVGRHVQHVGLEFGTHRQPPIRWSGDCHGHRPARPDGTTEEPATGSIPKEPPMTHLHSGTVRHGPGRPPINRAR
ncbi:hypothetical protein SHJG_8825 [Streptomyces hygroscopicus subsp. jinggangensis 5008]|nr:hypothetical protein SHJG_8825 [Streptomyces hygroscopicus subsp. jinggangensis 5008]AGF68243.1 hypothetical protein SHJGH_8581 [Streptomyces hygroscopicus subsp. jinggangensis TL01]